MVIKIENNKYDVPEEEVNKFKEYFKKINEDFKKNKDSQNTTISSLFFSTTLIQYATERWGKWLV